jgi:hypothetical protein
MIRSGQEGCKKTKCVSKQIQLKAQVAAHYVEHVHVKLCKESLSFQDFLNCMYQTTDADHAVLECSSGNLDVEI